MAALCLIIIAAGKTSFVLAGSMRTVYELMGMMGMMFIFAFMGFLVISATNSKIKKGFNTSPATNEAVADLFFNLKVIGAEITVRDAHSAQTDGVWRVGHIHTAHKAILKHHEHLKDVDAKEIVKNWYLR